VIGFTYLLGRRERIADSHAHPVLYATTAPTGNLTFPQMIANFFQGPDNTQCEQTSARDQCSATVVCDQVNHPAGMFILNSFTLISDVRGPLSSKKK